MPEEIIDDDITPDEENEREYASAVSDLEGRCKLEGIEVTRHQDLDEESWSPVVHMPSGREKRPFKLWSLQSIRRFLAIPFEKFTCLSDYEAICSYSDSTIEGMIRPLDRIGSSTIWRRIYGEKAKKPEVDNGYSIEVSSKDQPTVKMVISQASGELRALTRGPKLSNSLSLKVLGARVSKHDDAVNLLTRLANAFFFQLEMSFGFSLSLERERILMYRRLTPRTGQDIDSISFPRQEYDEAPISLYWYGCSAIGMPLLQFLAFYQVLEYYFPTYSQADAKRRIRNILKDPLFRADRDAHIGHLLTAIISRGGSLGDEKSQLHATLHECIDPEHLRAFLIADDKMTEFLQKKKGLSSHKITLTNPATDLRKEVADRVYDIRCKIVHTKADGLVPQSELLLPFSKEANDLYYDVVLLRYLARQVLIAASSTLRLP